MTNCCPTCRHKITKELRYVLGVEIITPCSICYEKMDKPVITECSHAFCEKCILKHLQIEDELGSYIQFLKEHIDALYEEREEKEEQINELNNTIRDLTYERQSLKSRYNTLFYEREELYHNLKLVKNEKQNILEKYNNEKEKNKELLQENKKLLEIIHNSKKKDYTNVLHKPIQLPRQKSPPISFELLDLPDKPKFTLLKIKDKFKNN